MTQAHQTAIYWIAASASCMALLIVAPLVLPEFWRRFLTEILIWGLLAMSSDILIGYTGMISFGHSAFFGLGMYGAAAALLMVQPPNLWLALVFGLVASAADRAVRRLFLDAAARHLFRHHHADLLADLLRHHLHLDRGDRRRERTSPSAGPRSSIPGCFPVPFTSRRCTGSCWRWWRRPTSSCGASRSRRSAWCCSRSARTSRAPRAIGYPVERYKIVAVMLSGLFAGLAGVLYAVQNRFAAPDFVYFLVSGETVIFNVMGGIGTLVGPIVGAGFFLLLRGASRPLVRRAVSYLIPLGVIFIAMIIFLPQGLLGFARRWLNRQREADVAVRRLGIIMYGVTGRMGLNQHLGALDPCHPRAGRRGAAQRRPRNARPHPGRP